MQVQDLLQGMQDELGTPEGRLRRLLRRRSSTMRTARAFNSSG